MRLCASHARCEVRDRVWTSGGSLRSSTGYPPQAGIGHGGLDRPGCYAALTLSDAGLEVLSVEFKLNLLAPAAGIRVRRACPRVVRAGRNITVCAGDVFALSGGGEEKLVAHHAPTMMRWALEKTVGSRQMAVRR